MKVACPNCEYESEESTPVCVVCRYPIAGIKSEKARFISNQVMAKNEVEHAIQKVRYTRIALFILSGLLFLNTLLKAPSYGIWVLASSFFILAVFFLISAFISKNRPLTGMSLAFGITGVVFVLELVANPLFFANGIFWKCLIVLIVLYGFTAVLGANSTLRKNPYIAETLGYKSLGKRNLTEHNIEILDQNV